MLVKNAGESEDICDGRDSDDDCSDWEKLCESGAMFNVAACCNGGSEGCDEDEKLI